MKRAAWSDASSLGPSEVGCDEGGRGVGGRHRRLRPHDHGPRPPGQHVVQCLGHLLADGVQQLGTGIGQAVDDRLEQFGPPFGQGQDRR